jgi:hypothetical protein
LGLSETFGPSATPVLAGSSSVHILTAIVIAVLSLAKRAVSAVIAESVLIKHQLLILGRSIHVLVAPARRVGREFAQLLLHPDGVTTLPIEVIDMWPSVS